MDELFDALPLVLPDEAPDELPDGMAAELLFWEELFLLLEELSSPHSPGSCSWASLGNLTGRSAYLASGGYVVTWAYP